MERRRATTAAASDESPIRGTPAALPKMTGAQPAALSPREVFGLSPFERDTCYSARASNWMAVCHALRRRPGQFYSPWPTFALALAALDDAHWSALLPRGRCATGD